MKKMFFLSLLLTVLVTSNAAACLLRDDDKSRIDFVRDNISGTKGDHHDLGRTLNSENWIEGYLNISRKEVELSLFNVGEVEVFIINDFNQIIDYAKTDTDSPVDVSFSITAPGNYYIIISSEICYAEGNVIV